MLSSRFFPFPRWRRFLRRRLTSSRALSVAHDRWAEASLLDTGPLRWDLPPQQGRIGDCWIIASLLALHSLSPDAVASMVTPDPSGAGRFRVLLGGQGTSPRSLVVDRRMPVHHGQWVAARQAGSTPGWPGLIEKAIVADLAGSYHWLQRGLGVYGLHALTGLAARTSLLLPSLRTLQRWLDEGLAVVASTHPLSAMVRISSAPSEGLNHRGRLPANHVFAVVGVDLDAGEVLLRNPWSPLSEVRLTTQEFRRGFLSIDRTLTPVVHRSERKQG